jgi:uncharacterized protein (DUF952 family)
LRPARGHAIASATGAAGGFMDAIVYKILARGEWQEMQAAGRFAGSAVDRTDGFIHLSTDKQVRETAHRHFSGGKDLVLLAVATAPIRAALRYEPSRGGALFPHLYGELPLATVARSWPLAAGADGEFAFPAEVGDERL